jgi:DNA repair protein RadC
VVTVITVRKVPIIRDANRKAVREPDNIVPNFRQFIGETDREHFVVAHLDTRNRLIHLETISIGSLNASIIHPREVFTAAVLLKSNGLILCHNHPSGEPTPSEDDIEMTRRLCKSGELLGIEVLDHIILGDTTHFSFREAGLL